MEPGRSAPTAARTSSTRPAGPGGAGPAGAGQSSTGPAVRHGQVGGDVPADRPQPGLQVGDGHGGGQVVALDRMTVEFGEPVPGRLVLDALRGDLEAEVPGQVDDAPDDLLIVGVAGQGGDEAAVDLDLVDREPAQVGQRRVTGAEVVDRQPD